MKIKKKKKKVSRKPTCIRQKDCNHKQQDSQCSLGDEVFFRGAAIVFNQKQERTYASQNKTLLYRVIGK